MIGANEKRQLVAQQYMQLKPIERRVLQETIEEQMGALDSYPTHIQELLLSKHLAFAGRFSLTLFVLQNGLPPQLYVEWLIGRNMLRDDSARLHIATILKDHQSGKLEESNKTAYKMHATAPDGNALPMADRVQTVLTPNFARMWQHGHFWSEAIATLLNKNITPATVTADWKKARVARPRTPSPHREVVGILAPTTLAVDGLLSLSEA